MTEKKWIPRFETWRLGRKAPRQEADSLQEVIAPLTCRPVVRTEHVPISQAVGRVLVSDVRAKLQAPLWHIAAVEGGAFNSSDTESATPKAPVQLKVFGDYGCIAPPGSGGVMSPGPGERANVGARARMPLGTDAVLPEYAPQYGGSPKEQRQQRIVVPVLHGTNVVLCGADISVDQPLAEGGSRLNAATVSALAIAGVAEVLVQARPRIAVCSAHGYYKPPSAGEDSTWVPDGATPLVLGLMAQWGIDVCTVTRVDTETGVLDSASSSTKDFAELLATHDLTIAVGKANRRGRHIFEFARLHRLGLGRINPTFRARPRGSFTCRRSGRLSTPSSKMPAHQVLRGLRRVMKCIAC
jgi:molybdopterin biosynthesis enzyme